MVGSLTGLVGFNVGGGAAEGLVGGSVNFVACGEEDT